MSIEKRNVPYSNENDTRETYKVKKRKQKILLNIVDAPSPADPLGMYTGIPENPYEEPVQDADDL